MDQQLAPVVPIFNRKRRSDMAEKSRSSEAQTQQRGWLCVSCSQKVHARVPDGHEPGRAKKCGHAAWIVDAAYCACCAVQEGVCRVCGASMSSRLAQAREQRVREAKIKASFFRHNQQKKTPRIVRLNKTG